MPTPPPVPLHLAARPTVAGLAVPWVTATTADNRHLFGNVDHARQTRCITGHLCQVCGERLPQPAVLFARPRDLDLMLTNEPACCPPCAAYSTTACPMIAGALTRYRAGTHPALPPQPATARHGAPAEPWHAVWVRRYRVVGHPHHPGIAAASWAWPPPLRIRPVPGPR